MPDIVITRDGAGWAALGTGWAGQPESFSFPVIQNPSPILRWSLGLDYLCSSPAGDLILREPRQTGLRDRAAGDPGDKQRNRIL